MGLKRKPITCYKVFQEHNGVLYSPLYGDQIQGAYWKIGETRRINENRPDFYDNYRFGEYVMSITGNSFHSCKGIKAAKEYRRWLSHGDANVAKEYPIAKCEIPLDTKFAFEGTAVVSDDDEGLPGYVSEAITIVKLL